MSVFLSGWASPLKLFPCPLWTSGVPGWHNRLWCPVLPTFLSLLFQRTYILYNYTLGWNNTRGCKWIWLQIQKSAWLKLKMEFYKKFSPEVCLYARTHWATISFTLLYLYSPNHSLVATFKSAPPLRCHSAAISPESSTYFHHLDQDAAHHQPIIPSGRFLNMMRYSFFLPCLLSRRRLCTQEAPNPSSRFPRWCISCWLLATKNTNLSFITGLLVDPYWNTICNGCRQKWQNYLTKIRHCFSKHGWMLVVVAF